MRTLNGKHFLKFLNFRFQSPDGANHTGGYFSPPPSLLPLHVCHVIKTRRDGSATFHAAAVRTAPVVVCFRGFAGGK